MLYFKIGYMCRIPYPSMEKARHKFRVFALPPHKTTQKSFWLRTALKRFDFCKLFLYYLSMIGRYTIGTDYDKVVISLG